MSNINTTKIIKRKLNELLGTGNTSKVFIRRDNGTRQSSTGIVKHNIGVIKGFMVDGDDGQIMPFEVKEVVKLSLVVEVWTKE